MKTTAVLLGIFLLTGCAAPVYPPYTPEPQPEIRMRPGERIYRVIGEVNHPGPVPYVGETSLIQAIAAAGGIADQAHPKWVDVRRPNGSVIRYDLKKILTTSTNEPRIFPGDTVEVK